MAIALLGKKIGMTRIYVSRTRGDVELAVNTPVTVIEVGPCFVSQIKTTEKDGYDAVQLAFEEVKPRNSTMQLIGHDAKAGVAPMRHHREVRVAAEEIGNYELGQKLQVDALVEAKFVDVIGTSKGKGFQGTMKRWNFKGQPATHGTERKHRSPGSIGGHATNRGFSGRPKKGKRMSGHMGAERVTLRSLEIIGHDTEKNLLWVKGPVPGPNSGLLEIRPAKRLYKRKAKLIEQAS